MARRTKEEADATRQALLDAAERVFYDKGVGRASLAEIAQAAGATRGAIYWHFKDKVDLFNAMMDRVTLPLEAAMADPPAGLDPLQRVRSVVQGLLRSLAEDEHTRRVFEIAMYRVEYVAELAGVRERHQAALQRLHAQLMRDMTLAARQQSVRLPLAAADAALGLQALFDGLLQAWILGGGAFDLQEAGAAMMEVYLSGLGFATQGRMR
ncbi:TetR family transcriptional regulator [Comamonas flocculans]|uniref:TetR family transcriptional regulator n=1 Tax=Comamonas flocculans TaxID=2597701 RepID=A0A5B8RXA7_9BURK|nr:TetR family transcriptional regulator [Comamonas flocculans]QEA12447.1 TetR family transcriptional regulator [Comamonas flocculans]